MRRINILDIQIRVSWFKTDTSTFSVYCHLFAIYETIVFELGHSYYFGSRIGCEEFIELKLIVLLHGLTDSTDTTFNIFMKYSYMYFRN